MLSDLYRPLSHFFRVLGAKRTSNVPLDVLRIEDVNTDAGGRRGAKLEVLKPIVEKLRARRCEEQTLRVVHDHVDVPEVPIHVLLSVGVTEGTVVADLGACARVGSR